MLERQDSVWQQRLRDGLAERHAADLLRVLPRVDERHGTRVRLGERWLSNFCSNDYLGLSSEPRVIEAWRESAAEWGVGSGASPLVAGRTAVHARLEEALAAFCRQERALLFPSGFQANLGVITALAQGRGDRVLMDRLCHASLLDAAQLARGRLRRFRHGDVNDLRRLLSDSGDGLTLVVTESVFSMDGDIAPLGEYARLAGEHGAMLFVDEAHAFGILGETGRGGVELHGLSAGQVPLSMATLGKALGVAGLFVAGAAETIDYLVQQARPFIYSTAMPVPTAAAALAALSVLRAEPERRQRLARLIEHFRNLARQSGLTLAASLTPIQPIILGPSDMALKVSKDLHQAGFLVPAIRPPTVPVNQARLRITLSSEHTLEQVESLVRALVSSVKEAG